MADYQVLHILLFDKFTEFFVNVGFEFLGKIPAQSC